MSFYDSVTALADHLIIGVHPMAAGRGSYFGHRLVQHIKVEQLRTLASEAKKLKAEGRSSATVDLQTKLLKKQLGIKERARLTPVEREQKKAKLKARLKRCR